MKVGDAALDKQKRVEESNDEASFEDMMQNTKNKNLESSLNKEENPSIQKLDWELPEYTYAMALGDLATDLDPLPFIFFTYNHTLPAPSLPKEISEKKPTVWLAEKSGFGFKLKADINYDNPSLFFSKTVESDKRFKKSNKPGYLYKVSSYALINDETLRQYGFNLEDCERDVKDGWNYIYIKDPSSNVSQHATDTTLSMR